MTHTRGQLGRGVCEVSLSVSWALSKDSSHLPPAMVIPILSIPGVFWGLSLWDFSPQRGPGAALAQVQRQHRYMTLVQSKYILPDEPHEILRHPTIIFLLTTPCSLFPWNMNSPDTSCSYHCALNTSHCWDGERNALTGGVGCVGSPREGLAFFESIFKSLSFAWVKYLSS